MPSFLEKLSSQNNKYNPLFLIKSLSQLSKNHSNYFLKSLQPKKASPIFFLICCLYSVVAFSQVPVNNDLIDATTVTHSSSWCSPDGAYTTLNATADGPKGIAWANGPNFNVWFKFQATAEQVKINLNLGSMRNPYLALWIIPQLKLKVRVIPMLLVQFMYNPIV